MQHSIADEMNKMDWALAACGLRRGMLVGMADPKAIRAAQEPDDFSEICGECGENVVDCTCPPNVNEDGGQER